MDLRTKTGRTAMQRIAPIVLVGMLGIGKSKQRLADLVEEASSALSAFGERADVLKAAARFVAERQT